MMMVDCCLQNERMWRCLSNLTALQELHTKNLNLADIPGEVSLLNRLTSLHHKLGLRRLDTDLSPLQSLMELDISGSRLGCIPVMVCQGLETLRMDRCDIGPALTWEGITRLKALPHLQKVTLNCMDHPLQPAQEIMRMGRELPLVDFELEPKRSAS